MNQKFIVHIGSQDSETSLVESVPSSEKLVEARDVYECHKKAFLDCYQGQEVLSIKNVNGVVLYTVRDGFRK